jgi:hypothetical protein
MGEASIKNALYEGLVRIRIAAQGADEAVGEFAKIYTEDGTSKSEADLEAQRNASIVARDVLRKFKSLIDCMQGDWGCWSEDRYKELDWKCYEEMNKLKSTRSQTVEKSTQEK